MKTLFKVTKLALFLLIFMSCSDDDDTIFIPDSNTIVDYITNKSEYSLLLEALEKTELDVVLNGTGTFTVFAPNNEAFTSFLNGIALDDVSIDVLEQLLLNHVLNTRVESESLSTGYVKNLAEESTTSANISMYINTADGQVVVNGESTVTQADIMTDNGVIHVVDKVISLPTMLTFAAADANFSTLATVATTTSGFETDFGSVLSAPDSKLTLLAPDNEAFESLGDISGVPVETIEQILLNHVIAGVNISSSLSTGYGNTLASYSDTDANLSIYIDTTDGVSFNGVSEVTEADIVATNGTLHKVNMVIGLPTVVTFASADSNFSTLVSALTTLTPATDFASILSRTTGDNMDGINPSFTVFAPVNSAFDALSEIPDEDGLTPILLHHVISEANVRSGDLSNGLVTPGTLEGDALTVMIPGTNDAIANLEDGAGNSDIEIIAVDVQAVNGVIHAINKILIPDTTN